MAEGSQEPEVPRGRRSKFDKQDDSSRKSGFDRRSRSPTKADTSESHRERSPVKSSDDADSSGTKKDGISAAMAAAARINAQLAASRQAAQQNGAAAAARSSTTPVPAPATASSPTASAHAGNVSNEVYQQDGDYIKDIEVNDLRNRYTLTKGSTQKMIKDETGADVTTRGSYYPDKSLATPAKPPLYLHITSTTKEGLERAVEKIDELMKKDLPDLIDNRRFRRRDEESGERDDRGRRKWPEERIPIDLEPIPGFNLRAQVVGAGGAYVKHIQQETGCRVQIKGRGSGFYENDTGRESDEEMYLHVAGPEAQRVEEAKNLALELLGAVRAAYNAHKERPPQQRGPGGFRDRGSGSYGGRDDDNFRPHNSYGGNSSYGDNSAYGYGGGYGGQGGYGGEQSPQTSYDAAPGVAPSAVPAMSSDTIAQYQAWAAYYAQNPAEDPYAAYGGYATMMSQYLTAPSQPTQASPTPGYDAAAPPPPYEQAPPPPPPPGAEHYSSVPPPPGL